MKPPRVMPLAETLAHQQSACARAGSQLYADVLGGAIADVAKGGVCGEILGPHRDDPFATALPLRFLGAVHRLVLEGRAPGLAAHYPSAGGAPGPGLVGEFLAAVAEHRSEIEDRLGDGVQTNEVGRSAVLAPGYACVAEQTGLPLRVLEIGASGGLNMRWDRYWYDTGATTMGDPDSPVRFVGAWQDAGAGLPRLGSVDVVERAGCDRNPIDVGTEEGRTTLRAYLWPDQVERRARLEAAFAVAEAVPATVDRADLGEWAAARSVPARPRRGDRGGPLDRVAVRAAGVAGPPSHRAAGRGVPGDGGRPSRLAADGAGRPGGRPPPDALARRRGAGARHGRVPRHSGVLGSAADLIR